MLSHKIWIRSYQVPNTFILVRCSYCSLISNAHQAHIRSQKFQFSCSFLYVTLISNAHQIPKNSFSCSFLYFPLICNAHQAHIRSQKLQFSCSVSYISLISKAHQIPKTFIVVRDRKDPEVQQAIVLVVMVDMVNVVKRLSTILELQERYVAHSPRATECPPEDPVYVDAHAAHQIPKITIFM